MREEWRRFRVSRIIAARRCGPPANAKVMLAATEQFDGGYHAKANPLIEIQLTAKGVAMAADHPDFRHHLSGNTLAFHCPRNELPYYGRELIRFGPEITILSPPELRTFVTTHLADLLAHHTGTPEPDS
ncbi:MAG: WYL domain-containing protein [Thermomicrobiales bacterium]